MGSELLQKLDEERVANMHWSLTESDQMQLCEDMFTSFGILGDFSVSVDTLRQFLRSIKSQYKEVPYHNFNHAVDVTVSSYLILTACGAQALLEPIDVFSLMVASIGHDVGHPGLTNGFHVHTQSDLFKEFGEVSPLETMHASKTLAAATAEGSNILAGMSEEDRAWVRELAEFAILGTDMAKHFDIMQDFTTRCKRDGGLNDSKDDRKALVRMLLKAADLGICGKPWDSHKEWADNLVQEAYFQREQEARVGLTETQNPMRWESQAKGQNWFLTNMCCPMFEAIQSTVAGFDSWVGTSKSIQTQWSELEQQAAAAAAATVPAEA